MRHPTTARLIGVPGTIPNLCYLLQTLQADDIADLDLGAATLLPLDEIVFQHARANLRAQNIDFLYGAVGALNYLSTRVGQNPAAAGYLQELFRDLLTHQIADERGVRFYNEHINRANGSTDINLGVAHGQCGLLLVLLKIHEAGLLQAEIRELVTAMLTYLLGLQLPPEPAQGYSSYFPATINDAVPITDPLNRAKYTNRMGWCYGDLNVVLVLYQAARILHLPQLLPLADEVGRHTCHRRTQEESGIKNAHFCHGSTSLVACYNALARERLLPCYAEAKAYWLARTIDYLDQEYLNYSLTDQHAPGLLMGLPGILLVLATELLDAPTSWEQLFLL